MEKITKFDLDAAFKALNEIESPVIEKSEKAKRLVEEVKRVPTVEALVEEYYDINSQADLEDAKEERDEEIAKAKLAKIEKIVDLDAESPEDLEPSYEGKTIIQCPQCMTMFYKDPADVVISEDDPSLCNVGEKCQHCGNDDGYTIIGKVAPVEPKEAEKFEGSEEENELNLDFEDKDVETVETPADEEVPELASAEETENSEEAKESFTSKVADALLEDFDEEEPDVEFTPKEVKEIATDIVSEVAGPSEDKTEEEAKEEIEKAVEVKVDAAVEAKLEAEESGVEESVNNSDIQKEAEANSELATDNKSENKTINEGLSDKELDKKLRDHNNFIEYVRAQIKQDEEALKKAGDNEEIKAAIQRRLDAHKEDLEKALPAAIKVEKAIEELPTPEEIKSESVNNSKAQKDAEENSELATDNKSENKTINEEVVDESVNKSEVQKDAAKHSKLETENHSKNLTLNESSVEAELNKFMAGLEEACKDCEESGVELNESPVEEKKLDEFEAEVNATATEEIKSEESGAKLEEELPSDVTAAANEVINKLDALNDKAEAEIKEESGVEEGLEEATKEEPKFDFELPKATNAEFKKMINSKTFKEFGEEINGPEASFDLLEEVDEKSFNENITKFLTAVYENVDTFETKGCSLKENKLIVEGKINFKSGNTNETVFEFVVAKSPKAFPILEGYNKTFAEGKIFTVDCIGEDGGKRLLVDHISYKYNIGENLIEGLTK